MSRIESKEERGGERGGLEKENVKNVRKSTKKRDVATGEDLDLCGARASSPVTQINRSR